MSNINVNDIVRIGKGKVEYRVDSVEDGKAFVIGEKSSRSVETSKLVVVTPAPIVEEVSLPSLEELEAATRQMVKDADAEIAKSLGDGVFAVVDGEVTEYKSFDAAAFALSRNHTYLFANIIVDGETKVKRDRLSA